MAVEAVPVVPLVGQHVLSGESVRIFLHPGLVSLRPHLLVELNEVVLHRKIQQPLSSLFVKLVVPVHIARQPREGRDLLLCPDSLGGYKVCEYLTVIPAVPLTLIPSQII